MFFLMVFISCTQITEQPDTGTMLLQKKEWYLNEEATKPIITYKYLHNSKNQLKRIYHYKNTSDTLVRYESFHFEKGLLTLKCEFDWSDNLRSNWELNDSTIYTYDNDLLQSVRTVWPDSGFETIIRYEYKDEKLSKQSHYNNSKFLNCTVYEYENDLCMRETLYWDEELSSYSNYIVHQYEMNRLVKSLHYTSKDILIQDITYEYDENGLLVLETSMQEKDVVSAYLAYKYKYMYGLE